jgi:hypothetical protein
VAAGAFGPYLNFELLPGPLAQVPMDDDEDEEGLGISAATSGALQEGVEQLQRTLLMAVHRVGTTQVCCSHATHNLAITSLLNIGTRSSWRTAWERRRCGVQ